MKGLKKLFSNINLKEFKHYIIISIIFIVVVILIGSYNFIQARYETSVTATTSPNIAFFIVDVGSQTGQIELENIVPRRTPYIYRFSVSNFNREKHADVDLLYTIEVITTTNLPLEYSIYSRDDFRENIIDQDTISTNEDGVYLRHLTMNNINSMSYQDDVTNYYYLSVYFSEDYINNWETFPGTLELVDIKINAEQDVGRWKKENT